MAANVESWVQLLIQVPLIGAFIFYSLEINKQARQAQDRFLDALDKRDKNFEDRTNSLIGAINTGNAAVLTAISEMRRESAMHDDMVRERLAAAIERASTPLPRTRE